MSHKKSSFQLEVAELKDAAPTSPRSPQIHKKLTVSDDDESSSKSISSESA